MFHRTAAVALLSLSLACGGDDTTEEDAGLDGAATLDASEPRDASSDSRNDAGPVAC